MHFIEAGSILLSFAFLLSVFGGLNVTIDLAESHRVIAILEGNPHRYLDYIRDAVLYLIFLPAVGLCLSIIGYRKVRQSSMILFSQWYLVIIGGVFLFWGAYGLWWTYNSYSGAIQWVNLHGPTEIVGPLQSIYVAVSVGFILWLIAGGIFTHLPILEAAKQHTCAFGTFKETHKYFFFM